MLVVDARAMGEAAFSRMARDHLLHDVIGSRALPADVKSSRAMRLHLIAPFVPRHTWLTGLGALWVEGLLPAPAVFDLVGGRGVHTTVPVSGSPQLVFHAGGPRGLDHMAPHPRVAGVTRASIDALTFSRTRDALPAVASAVRAGLTTVAQLHDFALETDVHTPSRARILGLVRVLGDALR